MKKTIDNIISVLLIFIYITGFISLFISREYGIQFITVLIYVTVMSYKLIEEFIGYFKNKKK